MSTDTHTTRIAGRRAPFAHCSCGYSGEIRRWRWLALRDGTRHLRQVVKAQHEQILDELRAELRDLKERLP